MYGTNVTITLRCARHCDVFFYLVTFMLFICSLQLHFLMTLELHYILVRSNYVKITFQNGYFLVAFASNQKMMKKYVIIT